MNAYMLVLGGLVLVGGRAADLLGRRTALLTGLGAFTLASAACAFTPEAWMLVAARAAQGAGGRAGRFCRAGLDHRISFRPVRTGTGRWRSSAASAASRA
jgi:MFS family permease